MRVHTIIARHHFRNNTYVIEEDGMALVVDPSTNVKEVSALLTRHKLRLIGILITHSHSDHIGRAKQLVEKHRVRMFMHVSEKPLLHDEELEEVANELFHFKDYFIRRVMNRLMGVRYGDFTFFDDSFMIGPFDVKIIHAPGHTPGSCIYVVGDYMFTGDAMFVNEPTYYHVPGSNRKAGYRTSQKLMARSDIDDLLVMPGHGASGVKMSVVKTTNTYFMHEANPESKIHREWYRNRWFRRQWWHK